VANTMTVKKKTSKKGKGATSTRKGSAKSQSESMGRGMPRVQRKPLMRRLLACNSAPVTMRQRCQQRTEGSSRCGSTQQVSTCWA